MGCCYGIAPRDKNLGKADQLAMILIDRQLAVHGIRSACLAVLGVHHALMNWPCCPDAFFSGHERCIPRAVGRNQITSLPLTIR
jgi:hypothetical protein